MPATSERTLSLLRAVRGADCPNNNCYRRILFRVPAGEIRCRRCDTTRQIERLHDARSPTSPEEALRWVQERACSLESSGEIGFRWQAISRMVDGIVNLQHTMLLFPWFESWGVTRDGDVKRLSEMGRSDPINVVTLSDYAFGIRKEHLELMCYGRHPMAPLCIPNTIKAINSFNDAPSGDDVLVPLWMEPCPWLWDAVGSVSQACTGRAVFAKRLYQAVAQHLQKHGYKYHSLADYSEDRWNSLTSGYKNDPMRKCGCAVDVAMLANVLHRPILMFDSQRSHEARVFVPFLVSPEKCRNRNGFNRSPLVLAWADWERTYKVAMVAVADSNEIRRVWIPRDWLKSVWGFQSKGPAVADEMISLYLDFDDRGRCLVANGIYFKPEYLRKYVEAFDTAHLQRESLHPTLAAELSRRWMDPSKQGSTSMEILTECFDGRLWRCIRCYDLITSEADCAPIQCTHCNGGGNKMRKQRADGTIEYSAGDHTLTPAPASSCFVKRKHFYNKEYDNPPIEFRVTFAVNGRPTEKRVLWFSGESNRALNSNAYEVAAELTSGDLALEERLALADELEKQVRSKVEEAAASILDQQMEHMKDHFGFDSDYLFDDEEGFSKRDRSTKTVT